MAKTEKPKDKPPAKIGRPSMFTEEIAAAICDGIAAGECLPRVCDKPGMPHPSTVFDWLAKDKVFADQYARAREAQGELMDAMIMEAATAAPERVIIRMGGEDGGTKEQVDTGEVQHRRLKIDALKWRAAHLRPKVYGVQRQEVEHKGLDGLAERLAEAQKRLP
jgi:hypothetical protein